jgi:hypothetical protein
MLSASRKSVASRVASTPEHKRMHSSRSSSAPNSSLTPLPFFPRFFVFMALIVFGLGIWCRQSQAQTSAPPTNDSTASDSSTSKEQTQKASQYPRGKKLILKDGSYQMIREYQISGDRVRFYSVDSGQWEEIPSSLIDWDATKKIEAQEKARDESLVSTEKKREDERSVPLLDIDSSVEAAPGVFLPSSTGLFAFDGKAIQELKPVDMTSKLDKKREVERVFVPIPIVPTRHNINLDGTRAKLRIKMAEPEFYVRTIDGTEPPVELIHAKIRKDERELEKVDQLMGEELTSGDTVSMERWVVAPGLYRYTLSQPLNPGEYALVEIRKESGATNFYIWDFGVDANGGAQMPHLK